MSSIEHTLQMWLQSNGLVGELEAIKSDASFRDYYRVKSSMFWGVLMDASKQKETLPAFIDITDRLVNEGVRVAHIFAHDVEKGFALLEDLGKRHLSDIPKEEAIPYYEYALDSIATMQEVDTKGLPPYDSAFLLSEMALMKTWYLEEHLQITLDATMQEVLEETLQTIVEEVLSQPQGVFVHRDFHSRNIMLCGGDVLAVIDYQDARVGAITYDVVSLLRDVYVELPHDEVERLALLFRDKIGVEVDDATFLRWFDFMGLQRHIKILGIFARLALRDNKEAYLQHIPLTLKYIIDVAQKYTETKPLATLLKEIHL
jgi:aminoglycoside/choline kinase family phosphotransferase